MMSYTERTWEIRDAKGVLREDAVLVELGDLRGLEDRPQRALDGLEALVHDLVVVRQTVDLVILQVDEHVVRALHRVRECVSGLAAALEVLATHEARVHVLVRERDRAHLLKVKVQHLVIDRVQVRALATLGVALLLLLRQAVFIAAAVALLQAALHGSFSCCGEGFRCFGWQHNLSSSLE